MRIAGKTLTTTPRKQERYDKNVHVLKRIIQAKAVALCAQQGLALRGHRKVESEDNEDSRDVNFQAILKGFAEIDPLLKDHLQHGSKNSQTKSWKIQNEIKKLCGRLREKRNHKTNSRFQTQRNNC